MICIDHSLSTARAPGWSARAALAAGAAGLSSDDEFYYISFGAGVFFAGGPFVANDAGLDAASAVPIPVASGATSLAAAYERAVRESLAVGVESAVVFVSDGRATDGRGIGAGAAPVAMTAPPGAPFLNYTIIAVDAPARAPKGGQVAVRVLVGAVPGSPAVPCEVVVHRGSTRESFPLVLRAADSGRFEGIINITMPAAAPDAVAAGLRIEAKINPGDPVPEDDVAETYIYNSEVVHALVPGGGELYDSLKSQPWIAATDAVRDPGPFESVILQNPSRDLLGHLGPAIEIHARSGGPVVYCGGGAAYSTGSFATAPLTSLLPLAPEQGDRPPLDLLLCMDASGSMAGGKWDAARRASATLAEVLPAGSRGRFVFFGNALGNVSGLTQETVNNEFRRMEPRGGTGLLASVRSAIQQFSSSTTPARRRIFLVSDGLDQGGRAPLTEGHALGRELQGANIEIVCFATGDDADLDFHRALTLDGHNGRVFTIAGRETLEQVFRNEMAKDLVVEGGPVVPVGAAGALTRWSVLPDAARIVTTRATPGAVVSAALLNGRPVLAFSASGNVVSLALDPAADFAPRWLSDMQFWRTLLFALDSRRAELRINLGSDRLTLFHPRASGEGAFRIRQGDRQALLARVAEGRFEGDAGSIRSGEALLLHSDGRPAGPVQVVTGPNVEALADLPALQLPTLAELVEPGDRRRVRSPWFAAAAALLITLGAIAQFRLPR